MMYSVWISKEKAIFAYKTPTGFTNETVCVYCVVKNKPFNTIQVNFNKCRVNTTGPPRAV